VAQIQHAAVQLQQLQLAKGFLNFEKIYEDSAAPVQLPMTWMTAETLKQQGRPKNLLNARIRNNSWSRTTTELVIKGESNMWKLICSNFPIVHFTNGIFISVLSQISESTHDG
jgi:hypothetical protein